MSLDEKLCKLFLHNQTIAQEVLAKPTAGQKFKYLQACAQASDKRVRQEFATGTCSRILKS